MEGGNGVRNGSIIQIMGPRRGRKGRGVGYTSMSRKPTKRRAPRDPDECDAATRNREAPSRRGILEEQPDLGGGSHERQKRACRNRVSSTLETPADRRKRAHGMSLGSSTSHSRADSEAASEPRAGSRSSQRSKGKILNYPWSLDTTVCNDLPVTA